MGMYNYVEVHESLLPEEYKYEGPFQTKSIDKSYFDTYYISKDKNVYLKVRALGRDEWGDRTYAFTGEMRQLYFNGDFVFYTIVDNGFIQFKARFNDGRLQWMDHTLEEDDF